MLLLQLRPAPLPSSFISSSSSSLSSLFPLQRFRNFSAPIPLLTVLRRPRLFCCNYSTVATEEEEEEEEEEEPQLIKVGYISKVHGLKGELRVIPSTDFPHLRFSQPGKRWLRSRVSGKEVISQVELTAGRDHPGQKSWIISLRGIDTVDQAKQIVGSTLMVREVDRPKLEEGEFYTPDLVGMRVVLKETGKLVGVVANVFNHGASDLLQVLPNLTEESLDHSNSSRRDVGASGHVMWVPFVEAIVPEVDMDRREMLITPPKGLLELNLRTDMRSKKERRQLEWKERKKLQSRLAVAKKNLSEMGQSHLLDCLKFARKPHKNLLIRQIVGINFKLFQHAMQSIDVPSDRSELSISANLTMLQKNALKVSSECLNFYASKEKNVLDPELHKVGLQLLKQSKVAIIVLMNSEVNVSNHSEIDARISTPETKFLQIQEVLLDYERLLKVEQVIPIPLILVSPTHEIRPYEELLLDRNYFGLDHQKVWFLEEEKLPLIGSSADGKKILMKSSCEILQAPTGSGGLFSLLLSSNIIDKLIEVGVEYVQIWGSSGRRWRASATESLYLLGLVKSREADIGINMRGDGKLEETDDDEFEMIFSISHLDKVCKQTNKQQFVALPEQHAHVELVKAGEDYAERAHPVPDEPNSYRLHSSIYSALTTCFADSICTVHFASH